jgi:hypothetical protein
VSKLPKAPELLVEPRKDSEKVGWSYICYLGVEIHLLENYTPDVDPGTLPTIKTKDLQVGTKVLTNVFGMWQKGIICKDKDILYVDAGPNITDLLFDEDDRHCWTTTCAFNKKAMQVVKIM